MASSKQTRGGASNAPRGRAASTAAQAAQRKPGAGTAASAKSAKASLSKARGAKAAPPARVAPKAAVRKLASAAAKKAKASPARRAAPPSRAKKPPIAGKPKKPPSPAKGRRREPASNGAEPLSNGADHELRADELGEAHAAGAAEWDVNGGHASNGEEHDSDEIESAALAPDAAEATVESREVTPELSPEAEALADLGVVVSEGEPASAARPAEDVEGSVMAGELESPPDEASVDDTGAFLKGLIEAVLFVADHPLELKDVARAARTDKKRAQELLAELVLDTKQRGIRVEEVSGGWIFRTNPQYAAHVRNFLQQRPVRLSRAQLETLAIIAYRQPVTRPEIDEIRGVDSGPVLKGLLERDLVRIIGKKDEPGRPMLYGTTATFLEVFSLKSLRDLPTLREFTELTDESRDAFERETGEAAPEGPLSVEPESEDARDLGEPDFGATLGEPLGEAVGERLEPSESDEIDGGSGSTGDARTDSDDEESEDDDDEESEDEDDEDEDGDDEDSEDEDDEDEDGDDDGDDDDSDEDRAR
jgi:segregation and condensation protein B